MYTGVWLPLTLLTALLLSPYGVLTNEFQTNFDDGFGTETFRPDEPQLPFDSSLHYDAFGQHDAQFDHELVTGSMREARYFKQLEPEEAKERLGHLFDRIDTNHDGQLDREELVKWIIHSFESLDLESSRQKLKEYDMNRDGLLTWSEYTNKVYGYTEEELSQLEKDAGAETQEFMKALEEEKFKFQTADVDQSGDLNETEYAAFEHPHNYQHMAPYEILHTLRDFDTDKDGMISEKEYLVDDKMQREAFLIEKENFKRYDRNADGVLDQEEMKQWVTPGFRRTATDEMEHLFEETDRDKNNLLSKEEVVSQHELWVGSQATDYGRHLEIRVKDEL